MPRNKRGFTMIEMMIAIAIIISIMGIALGVWFGIGQAIPRVQAESLIKQAILSARQRSLTTRQPITLIFDSDTNSIQGVERQRLWTENFENIAAENIVDEGLDQNTIDELSIQFGYTGSGWYIQDSTVPVDARLAPTQIPDPTDITQLPIFLDKNSGFVLSCHFRVPATPLTHENIETDNERSGAVKPLILLSTNLDDPNIEDALFAAELWLQPMHAEDRNPKDSFVWEQTPRAYTWIPIAWAGTRPDDPTPRTNDDAWQWFDRVWRPSSWNSQYRDSTNILARYCSLYKNDSNGGHTYYPDYGVQNILENNQWYHLQLTWDGKLFSLYIDGFLIDELEFLDGLNGIDDLTSDDIIREPLALWIGQHEVNGNLRRGENIAIDACSIDRISRRQNIPLPNQITIDNDLDKDGNPDPIPQSIRLNRGIIEFGENGNRDLILFDNTKNESINFPLNATGINN